MKQYNIGVVILNYMAYQETIDTIMSFLSQKCDDSINMEIVVVDNASTNDSYEQLCQKFQDQKNVHICKTEQNLGFANGNNFGYFYLLKIMKPDFVIVSNDDILLKQQGLFDWMLKCFDETNFAVLGPDIYSIRGKYHQSPGENHTRSRIKCQKSLCALRIRLFKLYIKKLLHIKIKQFNAVWENHVYQTPTAEKTLHGAFQIFSNVYFSYYHEPYDPGTFLYMEEALLKLRCDAHNLVMYYSPEYRVEHLQAVATNMVSDSNVAKAINRTRRDIFAMKVYINRIRKTIYKQN